MEALLKRAYEICNTAHEGQVDKAGKPYHLHPERVDARCAAVARLRRYLAAYHFLQADQ